MAVVTIRGVPINFPFEPYNLQKDYMDRVLDCLQNEKNGILESPTGTGKTLSLLCSSLAWLELKKAQLQVHRRIMFNEDEYLGSLKSELEKSVGKPSGRSFIGLPTIIYASRTHSQLSQAMQELKRTSYNHMKACVLGSRDQMCIHPEVIAEENSTLRIQMCQLKVKTRSCHFYNRVETKKADPAISELSIIDIEDFIKLGNCHKFCPYYMTKELKQHADIIFMPYNYLLDPLSRKALGVELSNNVIILDEAHNIERMCEESASLQIKTSDIALAIEEVTAVMKIISEDNAIAFDETPKDFSAEDLCILKEMFLNLEKELDNIEIQRNSAEGTNFNGGFIFDFLSKAGVTVNNYNRYMQVITNIIQYLTALNNGPFARRGNGLQIFEELLRIVFIGTSNEFREKVKKCYRVHITEEEIKKKKPNNWLSKAVAKPGGRILSYWCFSPGFGMNMLMGHGLKCIILTSGTLAPLRPLISELELNIDVCLENPHIVKSNQICVKIITAGPDCEILNCNFQNRDNPKYLSSLGTSILNFSRIVPNGLLIFFPSYPILQRCQQHWQETGIWGNINAQKTIYVELRDKNLFKNTMDEYYSKVQDKNLKGAIFMGVCRGKISEGLDFADANGRGVIIIGLPFPPVRDPKIILKKRYLDICNAKNKEFLKGDDWYSLEATRAVNQAIGRVIRHRNDYGAILLLDARFNNFKIKNQMSMWLRDHIKVVNNFGEVIRDLRNFYKNAESVLPAPQLAFKSSQTTSVKFDPRSYTKGNFDFSTSLVGGSSSGSKRNMSNQLENPIKRKKINVVSNSSDVENTTAKDYIAMVRKQLDGQSFTSLTNAMKYYKETENLNNLIHTLDNIFVSKHNLRYLIQGLQPYVKDRHKEAFNQFWEKMR